jgi:maspardin
MKNKIRTFLIVLLVVFAASYLISTPHHSASELYKGKDQTVLNSLSDFRKNPTQSLDYEGNTWKYLATGKGKESILFLHGMAGNYDFWWQQINAFKDDYRIVSVSYPPVQNLAEMGKAIIAILNKNNIQEVNVVGSSLGGYFAQYLVATYPKRIKKVVFGNTFPPNDLLEKQNSKLALIAQLVPEWLMMYFLRQGLYKNVIPAAQNDPLAKAVLVENTYGRMSKAQFVARYNCVIDKFQPINNTQKQRDILIIESDNDPLVPLELRTKLKQSYPQAQVHTFHEKGHFPYLNATIEYNEALKQFLSDSLKVVQ